jgi:hypothetical protein
MICALMIDLDDSADFPGNTGVALGRPFSAYPVIVAKSSAHIQRTYVVTASQPVKGVALQYGSILIDPPAGEAPSAQALLRHGAALIGKELKEEGGSLELLVVLSANAPALTRELLDAGIEALQARPELDSAVSVSPNRRCSPLYARRQDKDGLLAPYAPPQADADSEVWFPDWGVCVLRPASLEKAAGPAPLPWLGRKVLPLKQWGGGPIDYHWQVPSLEYWLKKHGFADLSSNLEMQPLPKPQPAPKRS